LPIVEPTEIKFKKLHPDARLPSRGSPRSAGLDLYSIEQCTLNAGQRRGIRTGLSVEIPEGFYGRIAPRSGLAIEHGIDVLAGVVDSDYRGEILCLLVNHAETAKTFGLGDRIAQLIIESIITPLPCWDDDLSETLRNDSGFGSSGL
jgi:dUTP pyrophosphatase